MRIGLFGLTGSSFNEVFEAFNNQVKVLECRFTTCNESIEVASFATADENKLGLRVLASACV